MRVRLAFGAALVLSMLAACVTRPPVVTALDANQQAILLGELPGYTLEGRVAVRSGEDGWQASVRWRQRGDVSEVRLAGPFGAGALQLRLEGEVLTLVTSRGDRLGGDDATTTLREQLGFDPPITQLRHWLLAMAAPGDPAAVIEPAQNGRPATLRQDGWQIDFEDYRAQPVRRSAVQMPRRIVANREAVRLRLVVDAWRLGEGR